MKGSLRYMVFFVLLLTAARPHAQNLTGTWEGEMRDEFLQVNIIQENEELCGYTWDYLWDNPRNYCKAYFKGYYDKRKEMWILTGLSFIENSGTHVLMQLKLRQDKASGSNSLVAAVSIKSTFGSLLSVGSADIVELKRVSSKPARLPRNMPVCFGGPRENKPPIVNKPPVQKPVADSVRKPADVIPPPIVKKINTDSVVKRIDPPVVVIKKDPQPISQKVVERKNNVFSRIPVDTRSITLKLYDNATVDGDTVSVYYNGRLLVNRQLLSERPIVINLELNENDRLHEITLFAENLGSIPPNTALVVVTVGEKRYELHAKANLQENAVLVFEYTPK